MFEIKKNNFDYIIIQESIEPRVYFHDYKILEKTISSNFLALDTEIYDNRIRYNLERSYKLEKQLGLQKIKFPTQYNKDVSKMTVVEYIDFFRTLPIVNNLLTTWMPTWCANAIEELCKKRDISGFVWSWDTHILTNPKFFTRIDFNGLNLYKVLKEKDLLVNNSLHQTEEGNKYIGNLINSFFKTNPILCN